ncbi:hypothetical protein BDW59DRAFT_27928 [Aspergillus cavernicola]|uniref:Uncharacterized protein n=1 Tax=Aspergillus cavernicola TaxID=176166 RepID=A0ABR4HEA9_9EURO
MGWRPKDGVPFYPWFFGTSCRSVILKFMGYGTGNARQSSAGILILETRFVISSCSAFLAAELYSASSSPILGRCGNQAPNVWHKDHDCIECTHHIFEQQFCCNFQHHIATWLSSNIFCNDPRVEERMISLATGALFMCLVRPPFDSMIVDGPGKAVIQTHRHIDLRYRYLW